MNVPPPLVNFHTIEKYLDALDPQTLEEQRENILRLHSSGLPPVVSFKALALLFGFKTEFIGAMCRRPHRYYRVFTIPKGKGKRKIEAPKVGLKVIQKWLGYYLARTVEFPPQVVGFIPGRCAKDGAMIHCGARWILSTDIENFFPTTSSKIVAEALLDLGYTNYAADLILKLCCLNGNLAQGSPASPVLSNLAFRELDLKIISLAENKGIRYSRYADDLVFSGIGTVPEGLLEEIRSLIESKGWKISKKKTELSESPRRLKVYGLLVHGNEPRLTKGYRKRIRAIRHLMQAGKIPAEKLDQGRGHLAFAKSIDKGIVLTQ